MFTGTQLNTRARTRDTQPGRAVLNGPAEVRVHAKDDGPTAAFAVIRPDDWIIIEKLYVQFVLNNNNINKQSVFF